MIEGIEKAAGATTRMLGLLSKLRGGTRQAYTTATAPWKFIPKDMPDYARKGLKATSLGLTGKALYDLGDESVKAYDENDRKLQLLRGVLPTGAAKYLPTTAASGITQIAPYVSKLFRSRPSMTQPVAEDFLHSTYSKSPIRGAATDALRSMTPVGLAVTALRRWMASRPSSQAQHRRTTMNIDQSAETPY